MIYYDLHQHRVVTLSPTRTETDILFEFVRLPKLHLIINVEFCFEKKKEKTLQPVFGQESISYYVSNRLAQTIFFTNPLFLRAIIGQNITAITNKTRQL